MLSCLNSPERFSEADLLSCFEVEGKIVRCFKQQHNSGTQIELTQVLSFTQTHALVIVFRHVAEVIKWTFTVTRAVCVQILEEKGLEKDELNMINMTFF